MMTTITRETRLIHAESGDYPLFLVDLPGRLQASLSTVSIDSEALEGFGIFPVAEVPRPTVGDVIVEGDPVQLEGVWTRNWIVRNYTQDEKDSILEGKKAELLVAIEALRVAQFKIGFPHLFGDNGDLYHVQVRDTDRVNILSYRTLAKEAIAENNAEFFVEFRVYENISVHLDAQAMVDMANASAAQVLAGYKTIWELKLQAQTATTVEELPSLPESIFSL